MKIICRQAIETVLAKHHFFDAIRQSFIDYSAGKACIPPVAEMNMEKGEVHIKYGYVKTQPYFVVKVASGFYGNTELGLSSSQGVMMQFSTETGQAVALLQDDGMLTDCRTALAGAVCAQLFMQDNTKPVGVIGTGTQALLQARMICRSTGCREVIFWGRNRSKATACVEALKNEDIAASVAPSVDALAQQCRLIVTTTPSHSPLLTEQQVQPGTVIIAVGADTPEKQELSLPLMLQARVIVDSKSQCQLRGEASHLLQHAPERASTVIELGDVLAGSVSAEPSECDITVVDLTGVAVQDLAIATAVLHAADVNHQY